jgi:hypothetical protein
MDEIKERRNYSPNISIYMYFFAKRMPVEIFKHAEFAFFIVVLNQDHF